MTKIVLNKFLTAPNRGDDDHSSLLRGLVNLLYLRYEYHAYLALKFLNASNLDFLCAGALKRLAYLHTLRMIRSNNTNVIVRCEGS